MARKTSPVSIYTVAKELGISPSTVSRAMNNRTNVSEKTRQKVLAALRKHQFKTNYPLPERPRIAVVMCDCGLNFYISRVLNGIFSYAASRDFEINIISFRNDNRQSLLEVIRSQQCSGILLLIPAKIMAQLPQLAQSGLPIMLIDETFDANTIPAESYVGFIDHDSYTGSCDATRHLLKLGHRNIAYLRHWHGTWNYTQRLQGYLDTMTTAGIKVHDKWMPELSSISGNNGMIIGQKKMHSILNENPEITAVMALNDELAIGALTAARERGLRVPEDVSIIGFDNHEFDDFTVPPLTTIQHPCEEIGKLAVKSICDFINARGQKPLSRIVLPTQLIRRNSTSTKIFNR